MKPRVCPFAGWTFKRRESLTVRGCRPDEVAPGWAASIPVCPRFRDAVERVCRGEPDPVVRVVPLRPLESWHRTSCCGPDETERSYRALTSGPVGVIQGLNHGRHGRSRFGA